jgi:hypothetical protein
VVLAAVVETEVDPLDGEEDAAALEETEGETDEATAIAAGRLLLIELNERDPTL